MHSYINQREFNLVDHDLFVRASGDRNPIHTDPLAARRTPLGRQVVHGMHTLLWVLESFASSALYEPQVKTLKASFLRPVFIEDAVDLQIEKSPSSTTARARLSVRGEEVCIISFDWTLGDRPRSTAWGDPLQCITLPDRPLERNLDNISEASGTLKFASTADELTDCFPTAVVAFGLPTVAALASCSSLVGMIVPGLHSVFSGLHIGLSDTLTPSADGIEFRVVSVQKRFRSVRIGIRSRTICGTLDTIGRSPPVRQPDMMAAVAHVTSGEFRGTRALVVGGSRGLGEITAKLLAAGGSDVAITYSVGAQDAQTVSREIIGFGGRCLALHYDVRRDALTQLSQMNLSPTHVFYFATPHIAGNKALGFDLDRFREFEAFYLVGFYALVRACLERRPEGIQAFYPSTTFISERPGAMTEYAMVKAAGELLCADIVRFTPNVTIVSRRLPRLPTDQTGSIAQELLADPIETLLPIIREMHT